MKSVCPIIILSILLLNEVSGQDLVSNPGFENYDTIGHNNEKAIINPLDWFAGMGTPDYWHERSGYYYDIVESKTDRAMVRSKTRVIKAHGGEACAGIYLYCTSVREYLTNRLKEPLQEQKDYRITFQYLIYNVGGNVKVWPDLTIQAALSAEALKPSEPKNPFNSRLLADNQLSEMIRSAKVQANRWKHVEFIYMAKGGEAYLSIGNFLPKEGGEPNIYIFVDNVSVMEADTGVLLKEGSKTEH